MCACSSSIVLIEPKYHVVIVTTAGKGHLLPMLSLADTMLTVDPEVCVTVVVPRDRGTELTESTNAHVRIVELALPDEAAQMGMHALLWLAEHEEFLSTQLHAVLDGMEAPEAEFPFPRFLLYDMFATYVQDVARSRGMANGLCNTSSLPFLYAWANRACLAPDHLICNDTTPLTFPGLGDLPRAALPDDRLLRNVFEKAILRFAFTNVALVNDCELFYPPRNGENLLEATEYSITGSGKRSSVYCTGCWAAKDIRLRHLPKQDNLDDDTDSVEESTQCSIEISSTGDPVIDWLNTQQPDSVVFVALGSWCPMPASDVCELARGLELSNQPFLWAYRANTFEIPPPHAPLDWQARDSKDPMNENGLPLGFEEAVKDRALVARWVDQPRILAHPSVACFVTHCGWNSLTEALVLNGKPFLTIPLGAEQHMNAWTITEFLQLGRRLWEPQWPRCLDRGHIAKTINDVLIDTALRDRVSTVHQTMKEAWNPENTGISAARTREFLLDHVYNVEDTRVCTHS